MINPAEGGDFHLAKTGDLQLAIDNSYADTADDPRRPVPNPAKAAAADQVTQDPRRPHRNPHHLVRGDWTGH